MAVYTFAIVFARFSLYCCGKPALSYREFFFLRRVVIGRTPACHPAPNWRPKATP